MVIKTQLQVYANIRLWCNGSTTDFGSVSDGSNPSSLTTDDDADCKSYAVLVNMGLKIKHCFSSLDCRDDNLGIFRI